MGNVRRGQESRVLRWYTGRRRPQRL